MNEELALFRDNVRRFIAAEIAPHYEQWERAGIFPRQLWNKLGQQGLLGVDLPEAYGGFGANFLFSMAIVEEFSHANYGSIGGPMTVHSDIVAHYILNNGTEAQKQRYLPAMVAGDCVGAIAMTEPGAGSDLQAVRTTANRDGDHFILNGSKTFITNGQHCDMVIVVARTNTEVAGSRGTSLFLVDTATPGFQRGRNLEKIGLHASDTSELFLEELRVPASALLGEEGRGYRVAVGELAGGRIGIGSLALGVGLAALDYARNYLGEREQFGTRIGNFQGLQWMLADRYTELEAARLLLMQAAWNKEQGLDFGASAAMAKLFASEKANEACYSALQLMGGAGYIREYPLERLARDVRITSIYEGTSEIQRVIIARELLRDIL